MRRGLLPLRGNVQEDGSLNEIKEHSQRKFVADVFTLDSKLFGEDGNLNEIKKHSRPGIIRECFSFGFDIIWKEQVSGSLRHKMNNGQQFFRGFP